MAADCVDGDYLGAYSRFFTDFIARVNPDDQLPVKVSAYDVNESELVGEIISVTLQYLNQTYCPPSLQSYIVHLVIQAIKLTCKKQPEICGLRQQEKTYAPLKLMQAITNSVNEICRRYLDNSRLALLPPPSPTQQVSVGATRNARRKMEDRHVVLHDLHTVFNIQDDTMVNYYAVFDGHGGQDAAAYCATHLHQYLTESVYYPTDPERALRDAFLTTDSQFIAKSTKQKLNGGTTAVCALVFNKKLYIAWVGDSMASLVTRGNVKQLVNPHRPTRKDECDRIQSLGGVIVHCMGILRVNGFLSISRAIGDVPYKPYISGEPEIRCVPLDGIEDFLIIACDGLWDYVDARTAALRVYRQVLQNPHDLKFVQQALLQSAKRAGSLDNITVIVVFLTPPIEIASKYSHLANQAPNGLSLNNMDPNNPISSNPGQFDVNAAFIKQQQLHADMQHAADFDMDINRAIYETARNGKHKSNDDDYDFSDLGPETNVDAIEDVDPNISYRNDSLLSSRELLSESEKSVKNEECNNDSSNDKNDNNDDSDLNRDNANVCPVDPLVDVDNRVRPSDRDVRDADDEAPCGKADDDEARVDSTGTHTAVDDDESPPSPRATKPLQHALIPEAENVADSEDSEDEWNYYRVDPNKGESVAVAAEEVRKAVEELCIAKKNTEAIVADSSEFTSPKVAESIKCEEPKKEISSSELVNIDISDKEKPSEPAKDLISIEDQLNPGDMDFQLNPEAAEFVPLSSPLLSNTNFLKDYPISGSPLKQMPMDDIPVPSQSEFEQEVCQRPREVDEKDHMSDEQQTNSDDVARDLDTSDVSSTIVEVSDCVPPPVTRWQNLSDWTKSILHDDVLNMEEYDIIDKNDPMMMSYEPDEIAAAFKKNIDLNALHNLSDSSENEGKTKSESDGDENNEGESDKPLRSPPPTFKLKPPLTPNSEDCDDDMFDVFCTSSTPHLSTDAKNECAAELSDSSSSLTEFPPFDNSKDNCDTDNIQEKFNKCIRLLENTLKQDVSNPSISKDDKNSLVDSKTSSQNDDLKIISEHISSPTNDLGDDSNVAKESPSCVYASDHMNPLPEFAKKQSEQIHTNLDTEQVYEENPVIDLTREFAQIQPDEGNAKAANMKQAADLETSRTCSKEITFNEEQLYLPLHDDDSAKTSNETQKDAGKYDDDDFKDMDDKDDKHKKYDKDGKDSKDSENDKDIKDDKDSKDGKASKVGEDGKDKNSKSSLNPLDYITQQVIVTEIYPREERFAKFCDIPIEGDFMTFLKTQTEHEVTKLEEPHNYKTVPGRVYKVTPEGAYDYYPNKTDSQEDEDPQKTAQPEPPQPEPPQPEQQQPEPPQPEQQQPEQQQLESNSNANTEEIKRQAAEITATYEASKAKDAKVSSSTTAKRLSTKSTTTKTSPITKLSSAMKVTGATARTTTTTTTTTTTSAAAKKPFVSRFKQSDGASKVTSTTSSKITAARTTTSTTVATMKTTTSSTMTTVSPRRAAKPKVAAASSTGITVERKSTGDAKSAEKKSTNSDAKSADKIAARSSMSAAATARTSSGAIAKTTLVKTSTTTSTTTRRPLFTFSSKPRPASAKTSTSPSSPSKQLSTGATRPKTAPSSASTLKPRDSSGKTTPAKSPLTDKQSKETANKQISRFSASPMSKPIGRLSGTSSAAKPRTSVGKSPRTAASPTKKSVTPKSTLPKAAAEKAEDAPTSETEVQQDKNSSSENEETVNKTVVITDEITNTNLEDDVPRKDASPVNVPTDNQLIN